MRKYLLHLLFWVVFFLMWSRFVYFYVSNVANRLYFSALDVTLAMAAFYIIYLYLMPDFIRRKNMVRLTGFSALIIVVLALLDSWLMGVLLHHMVIPIHFDFYWEYKDLQYNRFFITLLGVLGGCFIKLAIDRIQVQHKMQALENEKTMAELTYLKAQINPHFLFNSLNGLYTQMELYPADARTTLAALADLLRYQLYECDRELIAVSKEMAYLENFFNLQKIRMNNCLTELNIEPPATALYVAPLLLIPFVENAFKYVSDREEGNFIIVEIRFQGKQLQFSCSNTTNADEANFKLTGGGIGIANVTKRLDLIYGDHYRLDINIDDEVYTVKLLIDLS